ncbi:MAG: insulinase family protein [Bacteroidota bacterium]
MRNDFLRMLGVLLLALTVFVGCKSVQTSTTATPPSPAETMSPESAAASEAKPPTSSYSEKTIPFEPNTRRGTLSNGLTYFIRKNGQPENYAELRLAVNAGSIQESEEQLGLAHFVEHMCFNGTKNFPKSELVDYLESIGTKFGAHLNAYTSFDETVYELRVPTDDPEQFDTGLQILEDWAHNVSFDGEEIEKERGVVIEEWRTRLGAGWRMMQQTYPKTFYESRYVDRLPIGTTEVLKNFEHETLRQYYRDWYRPDLMAVVAVGDFDVDEVEQMIKEKFGRISAVENPKKREVYPIPDHQETLISIAADEEASFNRVEILYKHDVKYTKTIGDFRESIVRDLASSLLDARLSELTQAETPPFTFAFSGYGSLAKTKDSYSATAIVSEKQFLSGLETLLLENERVQRFGYTQSELDRAKSSIEAGLEKSLKEKDKTESRRIVRQYVYHFLEGDPVPGVDNTVKLYREYLPGISLEEVNEAFKEFIREDNRVITIAGAQKEGISLPTDADVRQLLEQVKQAELSPYEDNVSDAPLMATLPTAGSITEVKRVEDIDVTELTLSNGVRVVLKPTTFKNDEIRISAYSPGGTSVYPDEQYISAKYATSIIGASGIGEFDNIQLDKFLSDKVVGVFPYISELEEGVGGMSSPKDLETCLQLIHLYFTSPRKDEKAFGSFMARIRSMNENQLANPDRWFRNEVQDAMYHKQLRRRFVDPPEMLEQIDLTTAYEVYKDRFADASDFTFIFLGNFEVETIKPLLNQYLASLPSSNRGENWKERNLYPIEGPLSKTFNRGKEPKSQVQLKIYGDFDWDTKSRYHLNSAMQVLRIMLRESMREDRGGVYGVGAFARTRRDPKGRYSINISFTCAPENVDDLVDAALNDMKTLREEGASEKNLQKIKETQRKDIQVGMKQNRYWLNNLEFSYQHELDPSKLIQAEDKIDKLTGEDIQKAAQQYFDADKLVKFVLYPETENQ